MRQLKVFLQASNLSRRGFTIVELLIVIVVIAILAAITVIAYNGISKQAREASMRAEIAQWKRKSEIHKVQNDIECPAGYIFVYGNSTLGTSDFCVMKYEAKNVGGVATSQASSAPWVSIAHTDAVLTSQSACNNCHLITEAEWMTIAADALSVKYNWSGWEVGSGILYQGHVNSNPGTLLEASTDDWDIHNRMTGGIGTTTGSNSSRVLYLSSGDAIWDFSGNAYEWTQQAVGTPTLSISQIGVSGDSAYTWREWTLGSLNLGNLGAASRPGSLTSYINPVTNEGLSAVASWDTTKGVGRVYANYADAGSRAFFRGGSWYSGSNAGVFTATLGNLPSFTHTAVSFRAVK